MNTSLTTTVECGKCGCDNIFHDDSKEWEECSWCGHLLETGWIDELF